MEDFQRIAARLRTLVLFRAVTDDPVVRAFLALCDAGKEGANVRAEKAAEFISALFQSTDDLSEYVCNLVLADENAYIRRAGSDTLTACFHDALPEELRTLQMLCDITPDDVRRFTGSTLPLPAWQCTARDLAAIYRDRLEHIHETGYGMFASYPMFALKNGKITPVKHPDGQRLSDFSGYALERSRVIANTEALLMGNPCNNVLLYGDAGSGKSSTVKAIANEYYPKGLRLIEVKKSELFFLPDILDELAANPLKFIIFIDDLSFVRGDSDFSALKAILEGSVSGRSRNVAIYATSNRRHLVQESMADREGDDLHLQDTIEELTSLSARFGLQVTFSKPDKALYSRIVCDLAKQYHVEMPENLLLQKAEAYALRHGGRSPRAAKQFIEYTAYCAEKV